MNEIDNQDFLNNTMARRHSYFVKEKQNIQLNPSTFRLCLPHFKKTEEYEKKVGFLFRTEPCLYNDRIYSFSSLIYRFLKEDIELSTIKEMRVKSTMIQRMKEGKNERKKSNVKFESMEENQLSDTENMEVKNDLVKNDVYNGENETNKDEIEIDAQKNSEVKNNNYDENKEKIGNENDEENNINDEKNENQYGSVEKIDETNEQVNSTNDNSETVLIEAKKEEHQRESDNEVDNVDEIEKNGTLKDKEVENNDDGTKELETDTKVCEHEDENSKKNKNKKKKKKKSNSNINEEMTKKFENIKKSEEKTGEFSFGGNLRNRSKSLAVVSSTRVEESYKEEEDEKTNEENQVHFSRDSKSASTFSKKKFFLKRTEKQEDSSKTTKKDLAEELPHFDTDKERRLAYKLVYDTLKYEEYFKKMLDDTKFFKSFPDLIDEFELTMVLLCDMVTRKFQKRRYNEAKVQVPIESKPISKMKSKRKIQQEFLEKLNLVEVVENSLQKHVSKLNACLARIRIDLSVPSLLYLLPDSVRKAEKVGPELFISFWINQIKISVEKMVNVLKKHGYRQVANTHPHPKLLEDDFMIDNHCYDLVHMAGCMREQVEKMAWVRDGWIALQDKSSSLAVHSIYKLSHQGDDDVIHINPGSGLTTCHVASLFYNAASADCIIFCIGVDDYNDKKKLMANLERFGAKGMVVLVDDEMMKQGRLNDVKLVLVTTNCSKSGVVSPVNYLLDEGEDLYALKQLAKGLSSTNDTNHSQLLNTALAFPGALGVVYYTRSLSYNENDVIVKKAIEHFDSIKDPDSNHFRLCPPLLPLSQYNLDLQTFDDVKEKLIENPKIILPGSESPNMELNNKDRGSKNEGLEECMIVKHDMLLSPSRLSNGCYVAVMTREIQNPREAMLRIIARAEAKGLIKEF